MINKNQNKRTFIVSALLLAFLIFILIFAYLSFFINQNENKSDEIKKNDTLVFIRNDVLVKTSDGRGILTNLPKKLDDDFTYSYSFVPKTTVPNKKLFMYVKSSYNTFKLTHDDKIIYERDNIDTDFISSGGDYIKIVMIPDEYIGKKLTISFKSLKQTNYGILVPYIILGTHDDLILYSYTEDLDVLIITAFLLVFGLESFVFHFALIFYKKLLLLTFTLQSILTLAKTINLIGYDFGFCTLTDFKAYSNILRCGFLHPASSLVIIFSKYLSYFCILIY